VHGGGGDWSAVGRRRVDPRGSAVDSGPNATLATDNRRHRPNRRQSCTTRIIYSRRCTSAAMRRAVGEGKAAAAVGPRPRLPRVPDRPPASASRYAAVILYGDRRQLKVSVCSRLIDRTRGTSIAVRRPADESGTRGVRLRRAYTRIRQRRRYVC
jgi:hypothetical protein